MCVKQATYKKGVLTNFAKFTGKTRARDYW